MFKKLKLPLLIATALGLSGCFDQHIEIKKDYLVADGKPVLAISRDYYKIDSSYEKEISEFDEDMKILIDFKAVNFNNISEIENFDFNLKNKKTKKNIIEKRDEILSEITKIKAEKVRIIDDNINNLNKIYETKSKNYDNYLKEIEKYMSKINPIIKEKENELAKLEILKKSFKNRSESFISRINEILLNYKGTRILDLDYFDKPMLIERCLSDSEIKMKSINVYQMHQNNCYMLHIPILKSEASIFLSENPIIEEFQGILNQKIELLAEELKIDEQVDILNKKISSAYSKSERIYGLTRFQIEGKRNSLKNIKTKAENDLFVAKYEKSEKEEILIRGYNFNNLKSMIDNSFLSYIKKEKEDMLLSYKTETSNFNSIPLEYNKSEHDPNNPEIIMVVDSYNLKDSSKIDVLLFQKSDIFYVDSNLERYKRKIVTQFKPIEYKLDKLVENGVIHNFNDSNSKDPMMDALYKAKELIKN